MNSSDFCEKRNRPNPNEQGPKGRLKVADLRNLCAKLVLKNA